MAAVAREAVLGVAQMDTVAESTILKALVVTERLAGMDIIDALPSLVSATVLILYLLRRKSKVFIGFLQLYGLKTLTTETFEKLLLQFPECR